MNCIIPILFTILASEPCVVLHELEAGWWKAEEARSWTLRSLDRRYVPHTLADLGPLTIIEEPDAFDCLSPQKCAGVFQAGITSSVIRCATPYKVSHDCWFHELAHAAWRAFQSPAEGSAVGHGGETDPYVLFLKGWKCWLYLCDIQHPYTPQFSLSDKSADGWCKIFAP